MAVKDVKIYTGAAEGWVSIGDLSTLPISSTDGTVTLDGAGNTFTVSTGGVERVAVVPGGQLLVGATTLENANFNVHVRGEDNVQVCIDSTDEGATTGAILKLMTGDSKYWNVQHSKNVVGSAEDNQLIITNGSGTAFMRGYQNNTAAFGGQVQTDKITSQAGAANDAAIRLGAGFVVTVGSIQRIIATASNLTLDFPAIDIKQTGSEDSTELFFGGSAKDVSTFARFGKIQGRLSSDAVGSGAYEGELGFWSQIGSPPYYRTDPDIQIKTNGSVAFNNGEIQTSRIVGATAPATDAAIQLGAELLTTNHTPTQPNSIATRQFVLDQAGSAGLVPFGTPTDDTTPDSPNGSTLHDNMFLYVKGTTSWRKSALYPLDSTGGGSDFPIPQPGLDAGLEWIGYDIPLAAGNSGEDAPVAYAGNAFFLVNQWSLNGTDWYTTNWASTSNTVTHPSTKTVSYGQNVFCGHDGYSYDGRNWTEYTLSSEPQRIGDSGGSFFYQGKHYARGGSHYFNGESWLSTGMSGSGMNSAYNYVIPCNTCCVGIDLSNNGNLQVYTPGDMSDGVNRWTFATEYGTVNSVGQGFLCVARDATTDICVALTNEHAWVQKSSGNVSFQKISLPVSAAWGGITHDGNNFIAVASGENSNISIRSGDGINWEQSTTLDNPGVTSMAGFNGRAITSGVLPGVGQPRVASILVSGNPPPGFRSFEVNGQEMKSQTQTNEFLLQEISRLQKLIEEKCSS